MVRADAHHPASGRTTSVAPDPDGRTEAPDPAPATVAFVLFAVDDVPIIEDALGLDASAELVDELVDRVRADLRPGDTILRPGDDEIALVIGPVAADDVDALVDRVLATARRPMARGFMAGIVPTISAGVTLAPVDTPPRDLERDARAALRRARAGGPGRVLRFDAGVRAAVEDRLWLETDVRRALRRDEITFHYQPELYLATGELFGFEALSRWDHPRRGPIGPDRFIPVVESTGHASLLFERVLRQALDAQALWSAELGWKPAIAVNLSPTQLGDPALVDTVARELARVQADAGDVWLELTESATGSQVGAHSLGMLRELGVKLAIDDFGSGYSSLARLATSTWDAIKIDRGFVAALDVHHPTLEIVATTIDLAHRLGMLTIAEGVETDEQARRLRDLGCDIAQGFRYSPAVPALDATRAARFASALPRPSD